MEALNPFRSIGGRGRKVVRAHLVATLVRHESLNRREFEDLCTPQTISRMAVECREQKILDGDTLTSTGRTEVGMAIAGTRDTVAQWLTEETGVDDTRGYGKALLLDTGWVDHVPDTDVGPIGDHRQVPPLLQALNEFYESYEPEQSVEEKAQEVKNADPETVSGRMNQRDSSGVSEFL